MIEAIGGLVAGAGLGGLYFGALWLTAHQVARTDHPGALVLGSYLVRLLLLGAGFYGVVRFGGAVSGIAALLGVLGARHLILARAAPKPSAGDPNRATSAEAADPVR